MTFSGSPVRVALIAAAAVALVEGVGLAAPAVGPGSGRAGASLAAVVGLIGVTIGGLALARSAGRIGRGNGRNGAIAALLLGLTGMVLAALHLATNTGAIGTGHGRAGAIVALLLGSIGIVLGGLARARFPPHRLAPVVDPCVAYTLDRPPYDLLTSPATSKKDGFTRGS